MPNIKQIITPDNTAYDIKDSTAVSNIIYNTTNSPALQKTINDTTTIIEVPDTTPTSESKHLITSGAVYSTVGDINTILENIIDGTTLIEKSITANGTYSAEDDEADGYSSVMVAVPNSYTAQDEGKVVSNGALVAQGSDTVSQNGTVDTTLISSLTVSVSGVNNSGVAYPTGTTTGSIVVSFIGASYIYVSTELSAVPATNTTAYFSSSNFNLSNFISSPVSFSINGASQSSATQYTMTLILNPIGNSITYKANASLNSKSWFVGHKFNY